jgi:hypothetical protein
VVGGFDLPLLQYLRLIAGGNTLVPSENVARALEALGYEEAADDYEVLARAENLALHLELPAPVVGETLEGLASEGYSDFPEPPRDVAEPSEEAREEAAPSESGDVEGKAREAGSGESSADRAARRAAREDPAKGAGPLRVQDPQAKDARGVEQEPGDEAEPAAPESSRGGEPGASDRQG